MNTPEEALALLARLGANPWLIRHHELKRVDALEWQLVRAAGGGWEIFAHLDVICEAIADGAHQRLLRSNV